MMFRLYQEQGPTVNLAVNKTDEAKRYVEKHLPLRKGWKGYWEDAGPGVFIYHRRNKRGRNRPTMSVTLVLMDQPSNPARSGYRMTELKAEGLLKVGR